MMLKFIINAEVLDVVLITERCLLELGIYSDLAVNGVALIRGRRLIEIRCAVCKIVAWIAWIDKRTGAICIIEKILLHINGYYNWISTKIIFMNAVTVERMLQ